MKTGPVTVLSGGVGGAKLVAGLVERLPANTVTAIVNTGDDFIHLGLLISPDIDTLLYTLSGQANIAQGWGREGETWNFMASLRALGGEDWFQLGDGDLATHVLRNVALHRGEKLSDITARFAEAFGIAARLLPMSDDPVTTRLDTDEGDLAFQTYFVKRKCIPCVSAVRFTGIADAQPGPGVIEAIMRTDNRAVLIAPSNPVLSVDPILAVPGISDALRETKAPVVAVSPLVGGRAVKGPTDKLLQELGIEHTSRGIARHYAGLIDAMVVDERDDPGTMPDIPHARVDTLMRSAADRQRVTEAALALADTLA